MIVTVRIFILYLLEDAINIHQLNILNMKRNVRIHELLLVNISQRRKQAIYQKIKQCAYTLFLVHLPYSINKSIIIHLFYRPWHQYCIIWVMYIRHDISSVVSKILFWELRIKVECTSQTKNEKDSIIVLNNGIHPRHIIYFGISLLIQMCFC